MSEAPASFDPSVPYPPGTTLAGRYRILRLLRTGGMSRVYLAGDMSVGNHRVAVKMLPEQLRDSRPAVMQFEREARALLNLSHPNIVPFRAFEKSVHGVFVVTDYIEGETLREVLEHHGIMTESEARSVFEQLANAIDFTHTRKIVHGDIKPDNIVIDHDGTAYLTDFGIATDTINRFTQQIGAPAVGTLPYMAPELIQGTAPHKSQDIYALAATMYECLAGHPPFHQGHIEHQILNRRPDSPRDDATMFDRLIMRGLSKDPEERPPTCARLLGMDDHQLHTRQRDEAADMAQAAAAEAKSSDDDADDVIQTLKEAREAEAKASGKTRDYKKPVALREPFARGRIIGGIAGLAVIAFLLAWWANWLMQQEPAPTTASPAPGAIAQGVATSSSGPAGGAESTGAGPSSGDVVLPDGPRAYLPSADAKDDAPKTSGTESPTSAETPYGVRTYRPARIWIEQFGTSGAEHGGTVAVDASGNVLLAGSVFGTLPGENTAGKGDFFLAKYDTTGKQLWVKQYGTDGNDGTPAMAVDPSGNVYLTGEAGGTFSGETSAGNSDAYLAKYDSAGNQIWVKQFGTVGQDFASDLAVDASGNVFVAGSVTGTLPGETSAGDRDAFLVKYNGNGKQLWIRQYGTEGIDGGIGVAVDAVGNVFVTGAASGALPGATSAGGSDAFLAKYDTAGKQLWVKQFGSTENENGTDVAVDAVGDVLVTGQTFGAFPSETSAGGTDAFLAKFDSTGNQIWLKQFGTLENDGAGALAVGTLGSVYVTGYARGPFPGETNAGGMDAFLAKYDGTGKRSWITQFGTVRVEWASDVAVDAAGNVFVPGCTNGAFPGETNAGGMDAFLAKYTDLEVTTMSASPDATRGPSVAGDTWTNSVGMTFAYISAGEFMMGSRRPPDQVVDAYSHPKFRDDFRAHVKDELPRHRVTISKRYMIGAYEVTRGQFAKFVKATGYQTTAERTGRGMGALGPRWGWVDGLNWTSPGIEQSDQHPVVQVSWDDAVAFCRWLSKKEGVTYRLPTEAEWEYACRAGTTSAFHFGDDADAGRGFGNFADEAGDAWRRERGGEYLGNFPWNDGYANTAPVGTFKPNGWGLFDMHGNVYEWTADWAGPYRDEAVVDPTGPASGTKHMLRGGSWNCKAPTLRSANRDWYNDWSSYVGFRVVCEVDQAVRESTGARTETDAAQAAEVIGTWRHRWLWNGKIEEVTWVLTASGRVIAEQNPTRRSSYRFDGQALTITLYNGSVIVLKEGEDGSFAGRFTQVPENPAAVGSQVSLSRISSPHDDLLGSWEWSVDGEAKVTCVLTATGRNLIEQDPGFTSHYVVDGNTITITHHNGTEAILRREDDDTYVGTMTKAPAALAKVGRQVTLRR